MPSFRRPSVLGGLPPPGPATKFLCAVLVLMSVLGALSERKLGWGVKDLIFSVDAVRELELWRLLTYAFVKSTFMGLGLSTLVLYLFGCVNEAQWGTRDFLRFFFGSTMGAAALAVPLSMAVNRIMPFQDIGMAEGPDAAIDAMLVALALTAPDSNVMFGFILPIRAKSLVLVLLAIDVASSIMTGASTLSITLGGMAMGYLLVTGHWRPKLVWQNYRLWRLRKRRDSLYVVPPRDNKHRLN